MFSLWVFLGWFLMYISKVAGCRSTFSDIGLWVKGCPQCYLKEALLMALNFWCLKNILIPFLPLVRLFRMSQCPLYVCKRDLEQRIIYLNYQEWSPPAGTLQFAPSCPKKTKAKMMTFELHGSITSLLGAPKNITEFAA